jgi:hypothetical protein
MLVAHVAVIWGEDVVAWRRVAEGADAVVGEAVGTMAPLPGVAARAFARVRRGVVAVRAPEGSALRIVRASGGEERAAEAVLGEGDSAEAEVGAFRLCAEAAVDEAPPRGPGRRQVGAWLALAFAAAAHAGLLAMAAQEAAAGELEGEDGRVEELRALLEGADAAQGSARRDEEPDGLREEARGGDPGKGRAGAGPSPRGEEGARRGALAGGAARSIAEPARTREEALAEARSFGMVGLLGEPAWGRAPELFSADTEGALHRGAWGEPLGGAGGLALSGVGEGGGGRAAGMDLGGIGALGHVEDLPARGRLGRSGWGRGALGRGAPILGERRGGVRFGAVLCRCGETSVSGRMPPESIQRTVRQSFGRFRLCYEKGLAQNPNLQGRVAASFVIGRDGAVASVVDGGSDLPDASVRACVLRAFQAISFSPPEDGIVTVTYPIVFSPE